MKTKNILNYVLIGLFAFILLSLNTESTVVTTCVNTTNNITLCYETDSAIYDTGMALYEGRNDKYGVYITNPNDQLGQNYVMSIVNKIKDSFSDEKLDTRNLVAGTKITFDSQEDLFNLLQQKNAIGNVTLFSQADINKQNRESTQNLVGEMINWTYVLLSIVIEFTKMILSVGSLLLMMAMIFVFIPKLLNFIKKMTIKAIMWKRGF